MLKASIDNLNSKITNDEIFIQQKIKNIQETWEILDKCVIERTGLDILLIY